MRNVFAFRLFSLRSFFSPGSLLEAEGNLIDSYSCHQQVPCGLVDECETAWYPGSGLKREIYWYLLL